MKNADLFNNYKVKRLKPRVLMHHIDVGIGTYGYMAKMKCNKCDNETDWLDFNTASEIKRGYPCPKCNKL